MSVSKYVPTIGIETHVQLKTKTKLFAAVGNDARNAAPNTLISHICVGMPGALPVLNRQAIDICVRAAFALATKPQKFSKFERKHYFYPDLPKGYQITQYEDPIIIGGQVEISLDGIGKKIGIERANLEEDAGKNTHPTGADYSLVDLNRAGTPLLEIVSKPDIHSPAEAKAYARELYLLMKYTDVTDGDLYHGHIRFDLNISLSPDPNQLGTRSEVKNLNSFRSVESAVAYEIKRQTELLEKGGKVVQETRGWDEAKQKTFAQRTKEEAEDYRYMPEPDVPPVELDDAYVERVKKGLPKLPGEIRAQLSKLDISPNVIEDVLDQPEIVPYILKAIEKTSQENARRLTFYLLESTELGRVNSSDLIKIAEMVRVGALSSTAAKKVVQVNLKSGEDPELIAKKLNLLQVSDESTLQNLVTEVLSENQKVVEDILKGNEKATGYLVGQVMTKSKGQANPSVVKKIIKQQLGYN
ncbi:Asp-tRNA(Asn)/Glu-tRNA(Gln) amidotransferase subunit GatB [Candidatus Saccharibacteria bacterium]|nr:Asp-tRNA(Asn)/Glu-tRNA(Gln) amidotransferase subunit GatB [Candidatus Saccharibacteria bacterium]MBI2285430.1 Asp-tRNA(Asn)/Glu-tRNA(Gln) amidotransferase subunit GatB [Candidatus Saccharibacteria bacterium]